MGPILCYNKNAVVYAALHSTVPQPVPIIIKSVCDYASSEKTDDFQRFAAYTSCEFAKLLYEKHLPLDDESMQRAGLIL